MVETMMGYTIEKETKLDKNLKMFLQVEMPKLSERYGDKFNVNFCDLKAMMEKGEFLVCRRDGEVTGIHLSWLFNSPLDLSVKIIQQQLFYVKENSGRSAYLLFKKFIDFGKSEADHVITMIGSETNIKHSTLERWGFKKLETLYRLEV